MGRREGGREGGEQRRGKVIKKEEGWRDNTKTKARKL